MSSLGPEVFLPKITLTRDTAVLPRCPYTPPETGTDGQRSRSVGPKREISLLFWSILLVHGPPHATLRDPGATVPGLSSTLFQDGTPRRRGAPLRPPEDPEYETPARTRLDPLPLLEFLSNRLRVKQDQVVACASSRVETLPFPTLKPPRHRPEQYPFVSSRRHLE